MVWGYHSKKPLQQCLTLYSPSSDQRKMRMQLKKIIKGHSTKAERRFTELLKELHIPFQAKVKIKGKEVDFLIGKYAIEIDGKDSQDSGKNQMLIEEGYHPIHLGNWVVTPQLKEWLTLIKNG